MRTVTVTLQQNSTKKLISKTWDTVFEETSLTARLGQQRTKRLMKNPEKFTTSIGRRIATPALRH